MSVTSRSPLRVAGAVVNSGNVNTGEQNFTLGGAQTMCLYSGVLDYNLSGALGAAYTALGGKAASSGDQVLLYSGAGRLKDLLLQPGLLAVSTASGVVCTFYDAAVVTNSGKGTFGPIASSGHKQLAQVLLTNTVTQATASGGAGGVSIWPELIALDVPFQSGLCFSTAGSVGSGFLFTITLTPETPTLGNPG